MGISWVELKLQLGYTPPVTATAHSDIGNRTSQRVKQGFGKETTADIYRRSASCLAVAGCGSVDCRRPLSDGCRSKEWHSRLAKLDSKHILQTLSGLFALI